MNHEAEFGYRVRQALNESAGHLSYKAQVRLANARQAALAAVPAAGPATVAVRLPVLAGAGEAGAGRGWGGWLWRAGFIAPLLALVIGLFAIQQWQHARQISELAALDFAVLLDDTPLDVYSDRGFSALLQVEHEQQ